MQPPVHRPCVLSKYVNDYTLDARTYAREEETIIKKNPPNSIAKPQRKNTCFWPSTNRAGVHVRYRFVIVAGPGFKSISRSRTFLQRRPAVAFRFARRPPLPPRKRRRPQIISFLYSVSSDRFGPLRHADCRRRKPVVPERTRGPVARPWKGPYRTGTVIDATTYRRSGVGTLSP